MSDTPISHVTEWYNEDNFGNYQANVTDKLVSVHVSDDVIQRHYDREIPLAEYDSENPTDGWVPVRGIIRKSFRPEQVAEIEAYVAAALGSKT